MALQDFAIELIEGLLGCEELGLDEKDVRFYEKGTTAAEDEELDDHIKWQNARRYNTDSNIIRNSLLIVQQPVSGGAEYHSFYVGELYRNYRKNGLQPVLAEVTAVLKQLRDDADGRAELIKRFHDLEAIREQLILRPLNYDDHDTFLSKGVYRRVGDMALVLYISLGTSENEASKDILSTMVPRELFQCWDVEEAELLDQALENTKRLQTPVLCQLAGGRGLQVKSYKLLEEDVKLDFHSPLAPSLTTTQEVNGAIAAFYPEVQERLCQMLGGDYYLVFTSIYDVHIHPTDGFMTVRDMQETLNDTNRKINKKEEVLSRQIYRYHGTTRELEAVSA